MGATAKELVTAFMQALQTKQFEKAATYLSDDFHFIGWTPLPLNKDQFIRLSSELAEGIPNLSNNFHDLQDVEALLAEGDREGAAMQIPVTQLNELSPTPPKLPPTPQPPHPSLFP